MTFFSSLPEDATTKEVFKNLSKWTMPFLQLNEEILRGESDFSAGERELMGAYVSAINECRYCLGGHREAAKALGLDIKLIDGVIDDLESSAISEMLKPVFRYIGKLTATPEKIAQADADRVFAAGWSEKALHDAVSVCCLFNFMNRFVEGHGIEPIEEMFEVRGKKHAEQGYAGQFK